MHKQTNVKLNFYYCVPVVVKKKHQLYVKIGNPISLNGFIFIKVDSFSA